jgi:hypothetical protein
MIKTLQRLTGAWLRACFPLAQFPSISFQEERGLRFLEEAIELSQVQGVSEEKALRLVRYVYSRKVGELHQEVGGCAVTLAALCEVMGMDLGECWEVELSRVMGCMDRIRAKQAEKAEQGITV